MLEKRTLRCDVIDFVTNLAEGRITHGIDNDELDMKLGAAVGVLVGRLYGTGDDSDRLRDLRVGKLAESVFILFTDFQLCHRFLW